MLRRSRGFPKRAVLREPAQYLLRFDDLCPTMAMDRWRSLAQLIEEFQLCPILAIVPDNRDGQLCCAASDRDFWARMRRFESAGATVALHGYTHVCARDGRSLLRLAPTSEFAGAPSALQDQWIEAGLRILRMRGLTPRLWVAPRHGFDRDTLRALRAQGIPALSDGLARRPFFREGILWIPQQLWSPVEKNRGLWTICIHPNTVSPLDVEQLRAFLAAHAKQFTSFDQVLEEYEPFALNFMERSYAALAEIRIRLRYLRNRRMAPRNDRAPAP
jgi:peptidoglycan/xylan/chitin deacetylase (PgdA/CDA1 family)